MKRGTTDHPKMKRLARRLGGRAQAVGTLEMLWHFTAKYAPDGSLMNYSAEELADEVFYEGESPEDLVKALVDSGWLDKSEELGLVVHDWQQHCEDSVHLTLARAGKTFADGTLPNMTRLSKAERKKLELKFKREAVANARKRTACAQDAHESTLPMPMPMPIQCLSKPKPSQANTKTNTTPAPSGNREKAKPAQRSREVKSIGEIGIGGEISALVSASASADLKNELLGRVIALTGDEVWRAWWLKIFGDYEASGGNLSDFEEHVKYAEDCSNEEMRRVKDLGELKNVGGFLVKQATKLLKTRHIRWPRFPEAKQKVG